MQPDPGYLAQLAASLPVARQSHEILEQLAPSPAIVVESPTGSGKTTQLPRILYAAGYAANGRIGVTQPRRIAAVSVTDFVRAQLAADGSDAAIAAYKMRFEDTTDDRTRLKIMTDGVLLQELKHDRLLSEYAVLMVDEAHERSLTIDFVLGLLKGVLAQRSDFKVIVSSATINAEVFAEYFDGCPIVRIDTPVHPVRIRYRPFQPSGDPEQLLASVEQIVLEIHRAGKPGDVLIFLSGERDIRAALAALAARRESRSWHLLPLYARLSRAEQARVFDDFPGRRKIVLATNIAETSVTIPGIGFVIDSGLAKINSYNTRTLTSALTEQPISHASCNQRRGRAGRTGPGACYRLYSEQSYRQRPLFELEEIHRTDLSEVVLRMAELEITEFEEFDFLSSPGRERVANAVELLGMLEALDEERRLTAAGRLMVQFPILPRHARIIVEAIRRYPEVLEETLIATAFLSVVEPLRIARGTRDGGAPRPPRVAPSAGRSGGLSHLVRQLPRQRRPRRLLQPSLPGAAHHARGPQHQGATGGNRQRSGHSHRQRRLPESLPVRGSPGADSVHLRRRGARTLPQPHGGQHLHPPRIRHVPAAGALPGGR